MFLLAIFGMAPAQAYLDPGSGSMLFQMIIGGIAAFLYTLKVYWAQLKNFFSRKKTPPR